MALAARIAEVATDIVTVDRAGVTQHFDLSLQGQVQVKAEYIDTDAPETVILTQNFTFDSGRDEQTMLEDILNFGRRVRDARVRAGTLTDYIGQTFPLDGGGA